MKRNSVCWCGLGVLVAGCSQPTAPEAKNAVAPPAAIGPYVMPQPERSGRAAVQHGYDADVSKVNRAPQEITVEQLVSLRKSAGDDLDLANSPNKRIAPFETSTYRIHATIKSIKHEKDGDFYFVIQGDSGAQAVVEVPDPRVCVGSPLQGDIQNARKALYDRFHPTDSNEAANVKATIVGVGYLGTRKHKGGGSFASSPRLMPGIGVEFEDGTSRH